MFGRTRLVLNYAERLTEFPCVSQVVLMLKSSDRVAHDVDLIRKHNPPAIEAACNTEQPGICNSACTDAAAVPPGSPTPTPGVTAAAAAADGAASSSTTLPSVQPVLVLRKWFALRPEREFRCFIRCRRLVGICQRDPSQHFPQLQDELSGVVAKIKAFHSRHVAHAFSLANCK